ncbi:hypothetical protein PsYK624_163050 [Phanerochaete sordida]|uniref:Uncharacterized protein n=1 Tax=Phanerochaete sordida TaxID=48140 RepID=A0A9P3GR79_9APHY|nr:hypothetical protein PsYK624_163050 [Phanerochaete sordida]
MQTSVLGQFPPNERKLLSKYADSKRIVANVILDDGHPLDYSCGIHVNEEEPPVNGRYYDTPRNPHHLTKIHRLDDQTFHFAFMPVQTYPAFPALRYTYTSLPIVKKPFNGREYYWLKKSVIECWMALEAAIDIIIHDICKACDIGMPLQYNPAVDFRPSRYKYFQGHRDAYRARQAAFTALRAFDARLCMLSYVYFYAARQGSDAFTRLGPDSRIPDEYAQAVKASWVCNPNVPRVGVFIDSLTPSTSANNMQWRKYLWPLLLVDSLPIWIYCGVYPWASSEPILGALMPSKEELDGPPIPPPPPKHPSVFEWLQKRAAQRAKYLATEDWAQRTARRAREKEQEKHPLPGRGGPRVFEWEYDPATDSWLRDSIPRSDRSRLEDLWEQSTPSMQVYNGVNNEWDVFRGLHPYVEPENPYAAFDDEEYVFGDGDIVDNENADWQQSHQSTINREASFFREQRRERSRSPRRGPRPRQLSPPRTPISDRVQQHLLPATRLPSTVIDERRDLEEAEHVGRDRYAIAFPPDWDSSEIVKKFTPDHVWVLNVVRLTSTEDQIIRQRFLDNLANCVHNLVSGHEPPCTHANFTTGSLLDKKYNWRATPIAPDGWKRPTSMRLATARPDKTDMDEERPYVLQHMHAPNADDGWHLVTFGTSDTAHAIRMAANRNLNTRDQLVRGLVSAGLPFRTLAKLSADNVLPERHAERRIGLGYKNPDHKFTAHDYAMYEQRRDALLANPHGRAAGLAGGILARLATHVVEAQDVLQGPSFTAGCDTFAVIDGEEYIDDALSDHEIDVICGTTRVYTHWTENSNVKLMSWWPTPKQWKRSGQDVGYWSSQNEQWFQNRLAAIRKGEAQPKASSKWSSALKFFKDTPAFEAHLAHYSGQVFTT